MRTLPVLIVVGAVSLSLAVSAAATGTAPVAVPACATNQLVATYGMVPGSNGTGRVQYLLTVTNRARHGSCSLTAPLGVTLLGRHGQTLPTDAQFSPSHHYTVVLAHGQSAHVLSSFSPDFASGGEPTNRPCEPTSYAVRLAVGSATVRTPMDPSAVCGHGYITFGRLKAIAITPVCSATALTATFRRPYSASGGIASYVLTLRNRTSQACHARSVVGLRLRSASGRKLATRVLSGVSAPYVFPAHRTQSATANLTVPTRHSGTAGCDPVASRITITPGPGSGGLSAGIRPPVRVCKRGRISLSSLFVNG